MKSCVAAYTALAMSLASVPTAVVAQAPASDTLVKYWITPTSTDSTIKRFNEPHYIVFERHVKSSAPLFVFLPGTDGRPANTTEFANTAAHQGYRVIGLSYNDVPAVAQVCPRDPDPRCSDKVRQKRIFGDDETRLIDDRREESIINRLVKVIETLQREHPDDAWDEYLENGKPKWARIAVSGLSQGAGMAAFIAQKAQVARVVLFSSPWDNYGRQQTLAPWVMAGPRATSSDRWFAAYHQSEPMARVIARAYSALRIPSDHIRVFTLEPAKANAKGEIPYHPSGVANAVTPRRPDGAPAYLDDWRFLVGDVR
jgi:dienelactone hydrolase